LVLTGAIVLFVLFLIVYVVLRFNAKANPIPAKFTHNVAIEVIWTVIPIILLVVIAIPSFRLLKLAEHTPTADMTVKVVGSQWFWTYEYPDHDNITFDSYIIQEADLKPGQIRLLEVDNRIVVPQGTTIKFLITAADVIHSFAVPALGLKTDAVPGRTNEAWTKIDKLGVYYGQCSEICGVNHGFMPIAIEVVTKEKFEEWVKQAKEKFASNSNKLIYAQKY
jgi:cytochrome c oxidase subunit 2